MVRPVGKACQRHHPAPCHTVVTLARVLDSHATVKRFPVARFLLCGLTAVCAMSFAGPARGDEPASDAPAPVAKAEKHAGKKDAKDAREAKEAKEAKDGKIEVGGRVLVRETSQSIRDAHWTSELKVASARLRLRYEWKRLRAVVSFEAAGNPKLKDGYVALDLPEGFDVTAGQFKVPLSPLENESQFSLPMIGRGLLSDVLDNSFHITGRRPGAMASWHLHSDDVRPGLTVAAFQEEDVAGKNTPGATTDALALDAVVRGTLAWWWGGGEAELGVGGSYRLIPPTALAKPQRYWAATIDFSFEHTFAGQGVRGWFEAFTGANSSAFDTTPETIGDPVFAAGRGLLAWRVGGLHKGAWYVEPYAMGSVLDVNLDNAQDGVWEAAGGVGVGQWKRWKAQLQYEVWQRSALTPTSLSAGGADLVNHRAVLAQLGASF
jgi:hypothetical protein